MLGSAGRFVGGQGIQLHGGIGMTDEYPIGHYYKRLLVLEKLYGDSEWHLGRFIEAPRHEPGMTMNLDSYKSLALRRDGRVLHATFNRPDALNAFDAALHDEFERLLHELPRDDATMSSCSAAPARPSAPAATSSHAGAGRRARAHVPGPGRGQAADRELSRRAAADHRQGQRRGDGPGRDAGAVLATSSSRPTTRRSPTRTSRSASSPATAAR